VHTLVEAQKFITKILNYRGWALYSRQSLDRLQYVFTLCDHLDLWSFDHKNHIICRSSEAHSLYHIWTLQDHSFPSYRADKQIKKLPSAGVTKNDLSHAYDRFLDTASSCRVKNRKNWVPASSDEGLWLRSKRQFLGINLVVFNEFIIIIFSNLFQSVHRDLGFRIRTRMWDTGCGLAVKCQKCSICLRMCWNESVGIAVAAIQYGRSVCAVSHGNNWSRAPVVDDSLSAFIDHKSWRSLAHSASITDVGRRRSNADEYRHDV